ncbi:TetR/AcrR family transcriptional regulator [Pararobbsia silviterrae]|uniref:TetR/AcrR family transcriptional regulator n=1 Tax=Pararobbsia silviterrae TaxID=1792498 RepID=A0A494X7C6_9BURK|nr:TetR/AcrR family transcriptional regulator [Pararobbsia silviterrae]RKP46625.1 TetR/AcrR family transcriptional regulator [Pararobbsia silviterrae]
MTLRAAGTRPNGDTKSRILDAAEALFIEQGFEALSLRQITAHAEVNLAAVNYHFGSKETLIHSMLARRLDRLNVDRLALLDHFEQRFADSGDGGGLTCEHVLGALFIPALRLARDPEQGGRAFLRLLGRAYTDPSSFVREFLARHYASVSDRIFAAFARALPHLPKDELSWRLHFSIGALSGVLAGSNSQALVAQFAHGETSSDLQVIARLSSLMVAALKAPMPDETSIATFTTVLDDADALHAQTAAADEAARASSADPARDEHASNGSTTYGDTGSSDESGSKARSVNAARPAGGSHSGNAVVGEPVQKVHASTGGSRTPISWPGSTTTGSFRYRVF